MGKLKGLSRDIIRKFLERRHCFVGDNIFRQAPAIVLQLQFLFPDVQAELAFMRM